MSLKKIALFSLKVVFSAFCIFYLFFKFGHEFSTLHHSFKINWFYLIIGLTFLSLSQVVSIIRWQICSEALGISQNQSKVFSFYLGKIYLISLFCNNFLPSSLGGDFVRIYLLKKNYQNSSWIDCSGSVLIDRAFGVTTLAWIGFIALYLNGQMNIALTYGMGLLALICSIIIFIGLYLGKIFDKVNFFENKNFFETMKQKFLEFCFVLSKIRFSKLAVLKLLALSSFVQILIGLGLISFCSGFNFNIKPESIWIMNPIATLGSLLAPSLSGLGVREGLYAYIFKTLGYSASSGIVLSLTWLASFLIISLPGAFYLIKYKKTLNLESKYIAKASSDNKTFCYSPSNQQNHILSTHETKK